MLANIIRMGVGKIRRLIDRKPTVVVNQPLSLLGNGGRKLVRMKNGVIVAGLFGVNGNNIYLYSSTDEGRTFSESFVYYTNVVKDISIVCTTNNFLYVLYMRSSTSREIHVLRFYWDSSSIIFKGTSNISNVTELGNCSLVINKEETELHACWSSKNSTYPNSLNIIYRKGVIKGDGSVTWGSAEEVTTNSSPSTNMLNPSISIRGVDVVIITDFLNSEYSYLMAWRFNGTKWVNNIVYNGGTYRQSNPSTCIDKDGVIIVAWQGTDNNYPSVTHIRFSKSLNGGITWESMKKLAFGVTPSITTDKNGIYYIEYHNSNYSWIIQSSDKGETWSSPVAIVISTNPNTLYDNTFKLDFEFPLSIRQTSNSVIFSGKWYEE